MIEQISPKQKSHIEHLESYYRFHSRIYDATRWSFLFGRNKIMQMIPDLPSHPRILEVGCGTGKNIKRLQNQFTEAQIFGIDLSEDMLEVAQGKLPNSEQVTLLNAAYGSDQLDEEPFDLILLSYSLTMVGNQSKKIFEQITKDLKPEGHIAVVDFHTSPFGWFRRWMKLNHVDFEGNFLPSLQNYFQHVKTEIKPAYLGLWTYFLFIGQPRSPR